MTDFEKLVLDMRSAQKLYFSTRSSDALNKSKALEKQVDAMLKAKKDGESNAQLELDFKEDKND